MPSLRRKEVAWAIQKQGAHKDIRPLHEMQIAGDSVQMTGRDLKELGMEQALAHAEKATKDWSKKALKRFKSWLLSQSSNRVFAVEDFREWLADNHPKEMPVTDKAWGSFGRMIRNLGLVVVVGERHARSEKTRGHPVKTLRRK
jgi:hypothetical protein